RSLTGSFGSVRTRARGLLGGWSWRRPTHPAKRFPPPGGPAGRSRRGEPGGSLLRRVKHPAVVADGEPPEDVPGRGLGEELDAAVAAEQVDAAGVRRLEGLVPAAPVR